jgi:hypothetical protein
MFLLLYVYKTYLLEGQVVEGPLQSILRQLHTLQLLYKCPQQS